MTRLSRIVALISICVAVYFSATVAQASDKSMRCGTYLIYAGGGKHSALMYEVLKKCGEPEAKQGGAWIYVQGNMQRILTFNYQGRVQLIESRRR